MGAVIGAILPLAVGVAISPIPVIGAILMLLTPRARRTSVAFLAGWALGILVPVIVFSLVSTLVPQNGEDARKPVLGVVEIVLGILLIVLAVRQWHARPAPGTAAPLPKWMAAVDAMTPARGTLLGLALSALNPKNLFMGIGAGAAIGSSGIAPVAAAVPIAVYLLVAASTVAVPVVGFLVASQRLTQPLDAAKNWLLMNNTAVMVVLFILLGVIQLGKGIGNF